jgi:hypothetical protein
MATKRVLRSAGRAAEAVAESAVESVDPKPIKRVKAPILAGESVEPSPTPSPLFRNGTLPRTFELSRHTAGFSRVAGVDEVSSFRVEPQPRVGSGGGDAVGSGVCRPHQAGRGPLAGPVVAAACVIDASVHIEGIHDSKKLNEQEREALFDLLTNSPGVAYAVSVVDHTEIDKINILQVRAAVCERAPFVAVYRGIEHSASPCSQASMRAMERAVASLAHKPDYIYVD